MRLCACQSLEGKRVCHARVEAGWRRWGALWGAPTVVLVFCRVALGHLNESTGGAPSRLRLFVCVRVRLL